MNALDDMDLAIINIMNNMIECKYHTALESIFDTVWDKIESHYDWEFFNYWLGDESNLGRIYKETFFFLLGETFTEEQQSRVEKKGQNLEGVIIKWLTTWKQQHPNLPNEKMPKSCLRNKIYQYIIYQLNKPDMRQIIGNPC